MFLFEFYLYGCAWTDTHTKLLALLFTNDIFAGDHGGSISAEHGVGFKKANHIHYSRSPAAIHLMEQLKDMFDPKVSLRQSI